jgi:predicted nucleic acid-binding protein
VTLVLDAGAVSALSTNVSSVRSWLASGHWPPVVPAVVLTECLTGDRRRDFHANRFIRRCTVVETGEIIARHAATLRTRAGRSGISAVDAIVAATADHAGGAIVLTTDSRDLTALSRNTLHPVTVEAI